MSYKIIIIIGRPSGITQGYLHTWMVTPPTMLNCGEEQSGRGELTNAPVYTTASPFHRRSYHFSSGYAELIQFSRLSTIPSSVDAVMDPKLFQDHQESHKSSH